MNYKALTTALILVMLQLSSTSAFAEIIDGQDCDVVFSKYCGQFKKDNVQGVQACLSQHMDQWAGSCLEQAKELVSPTGQALMSCASDYKKLCGIDIGRLENSDQDDKRALDCVLSHWNQLSPGCQAINKGLLELTGANIQRLVQSRKNIRVGSNGPTVKSWAQQGDTIWYEAQMVRKKVLERFEFCPETENKGLRKLDAINQGVCFYLVVAPWRKHLINELRENKVLDVINGDGLETQLRFTSNRSFHAAFPTINSILKNYKDRCPDGFMVDVYNYNNSTTQEVTCTRLDYDKCPEGYYKSYYDDGYFGCIKMASCKETNPSYVELGNFSGMGKLYCGACPAGGCFDFEQTRKIGQSVCKVNSKNPKKTIPCSPYDIVRQFDNGKLAAEIYYLQPNVVKTYYYDENESLLSVTDFGKDGKPHKQYDAKGKLQKEWVYKGTNLEKVISYDQPKEAIKID